LGEINFLSLQLGAGR